MSILEVAAQVGGISGLFAVILFFVYRQDRKESEKRLIEDRKFMEDRLTTVLENYNRNCKEQVEIQSKTREAITELTIYLKKKNGNC